MALEFTPRLLSRHQTVHDVHVSAFLSGFSDLSVRTCRIGARQYVEGVPGVNKAVFA